MAPPCPRRPRAARGRSPCGLGMAPARNALERVRDRVLWKLLIRQYAKAMLPRLNALRADAGLPPLVSPVDHVLGPDRLLVLTGDPLEYPRTDVPTNVRLVSAQLCAPPADSP